MATGSPEGVAGPESEFGALRHHLRLSHRDVPPSVRLLRNQDDWAGRIRRTAALPECHASRWMCPWDKRHPTCDTQLVTPNL